MIGRANLLFMDANSRDTIRNAGRKWIGMASRFVPVLDIPIKKERGVGIASRFLPVLDIIRKKERRFRYDQ